MDIYSVVEFIDDNSVAVVPFCWISKDQQGKLQCPWPSEDSNCDIEEAVKLRLPAAEEWLPYRIKLFSSFEKLDDANSGLKIAENCSDSDVELKPERRKAKKPLRYRDSSSDGPVIKKPCNKKSIEANKTLIGLPPPPKPLQRQHQLTEPENHPSNFSFISESDIVLHGSIPIPENNVSVIANVTPTTEEVTHTLPPSSTYPAPIPRAGSSNFQRTLDTSMSIRSSSDIEVWIQELSRLVNVIRSDQILILRQTERNTERLDEIMETFNNRPVNTGITTEMVKETFRELPAKDVATVTELEVKIKQHEKFHQELVMHLQLVGGVDLGDYVRRILAALMTDTTAQHYSWRGQKKNIKFEEMSLCKVVIDTVRYKQRFRNTDLKEIQTFTMDFFKYAKIRADRAIAKQQNIQNEQ